MRYVVGRLFFAVVFTGILLLCAGRWDVERAWIYLGVIAVAELGSAWAVRARSPGLLTRRGTPGAGTEPFDRVFMALYVVLGLVMPVAGGIDLGAPDNARLPAWMIWPGMLLHFGSFAFATWAMIANEHFELTVRIQSDRDHHVVEDGPYALIRHPGYAGAIVGAMACSLILGSIWSIYPVVGVTILFGWRIAMEERTLTAGLPGYVEYTRKTRYRLLPGVW
jgi:protein-S-isoprenylcysteine O-methyltransferase Ste14